MGGDTGVDGRVWVLLHEVSGPVNLGGVCRAMANTGFRRLRFSGPLHASNGEARKYAVHAKPILDAAERVPGLPELTRGLDAVFGFSPRNPWQDGHGLGLDQFHRRFNQLAGSGKAIGLLFGNEARGLSNTELAECHYRVALPAHEDYASLNLAQAVMVVLWELHRGRDRRPEPESGERAPSATPEEMELLLVKTRAFLDTFEALNPQNPELIWQEIALMLKTRDWTQRELTLWHAMFHKARSRYLAQHRSERDAGIETGVDR